MDPAKDAFFQALKADKKLEHRIDNDMIVDANRKYQLVFNQWSEGLITMQEITYKVMDIFGDLYHRSQKRDLDEKIEEAAKLALKYR